MVEDEQLTIECGSAMVVAAVREYQDLVGGEDIALVISGGNADGVTLSKVLGLREPRNG